MKGTRVLGALAPVALVGALPLPAAPADGGGESNGDPGNEVSNGNRPQRSG